VIDIRKIADAIFVVSQIYMHDSDIRSSKLLESYILSLPQTVELIDVNGGCDYIARFSCTGTDDYYAIARKLLEEEPFRVRQILSYIVLRELKPFAGFDLNHLTSEHS
jgi:hypothetical protein